MASAIPRTRRQLTEALAGSYGKLRAELDRGGPRAGSLVCVDDWNIKQLLAVRCWWSESVVDWVRRGRGGVELDLPAPGFRWSETPRLNAGIAQRARRASYASVRKRLDRAYAEVLRTVDELTDRELCAVGVFDWAGKYPICRWIALNTSRQYTTARMYVRRAIDSR
jgi:hypothetical protein